MEPDHHLRFFPGRIRDFNHPVIIVEPNGTFDAVIDQAGRGNLQIPGGEDV